MVAELLIWAWGRLRYLRAHPAMHGKPIWHDPFTYVMFFPAIIAGPIGLLVFEEYPDRHPERQKKEAVSEL